MQHFTYQGLSKRHLQEGDFLVGVGGVLQGSWVVGSIFGLSHVALVVLQRSGMCVAPESRLCKEVQGDAVDEVCDVTRLLLRLCWARNPSRSSARTCSTRLLDGSEIGSQASKNVPEMGSWQEHKNCIDNKQTSICNW